MTYFRATTRQCQTDGCTLRGIQIPKFTSIQIDMRTVHFNPEYYPEPDVFDPERCHYTLYVSPYEHCLTPFKLKKIYICFCSVCMYDINLEFILF